MRFTFTVYWRLGACAKQFRCSSRHKYPSPQEPRRRQAATASNRFQAFGSRFSSCMQQFVSQAIFSNSRRRVGKEFHFSAGASISSSEGQLVAVAAYKTSAVVFLRAARITETSTMNTSMSDFPGFTITCFRLCTWLLFWRSHQPHSRRLDVLEGSESLLEMMQGEAQDTNSTLAI